MFTSEGIFYIIIGNRAEIFASMHKLPSKIAHSPTTYLSERELNRPDWPDTRPSRGARLLDPNQADNLRMGSSAALVSSTGNMEGSVSMKSVKIESGPPTHVFRYVLYNWLFMGQVEGSTDPQSLSLRIPPDDARGAVFMDEENRLVGFFQYYIKEGPWAGFCASISPSEYPLVGAGYRRA